MLEPEFRMNARTNEDEFADLQLILDVSRRMASTIELEPLLKGIAEATQKVLQCERATVFVLDSEKEQLYSRVATGVDEIRVSATEGIAGYVATTGNICNVPDAYADDRFNTGPRSSASGT